MRYIVPVRPFAAAAALVASTVLGGCHSTHLAATWRDPGVTTLNFKKPIVVFVSKSEVFRRMMEDKMAAAFPRAIQGYRVLEMTDNADGARVRDKLAEKGFDGAMIMRVANVDERVTYTPGTYWYGAPYYTFAGYWGNAWGYPYDPAYVTTDMIVSIETQIYNLHTDKLVWAARSETTDPKSVSKLGDSVLRHVMNRLNKDGLLAAPMVGQVCTEPTLYVGG